MKPLLLPVCLVISIAVPALGRAADVSIERLESGASDAVQNQFYLRVGVAGLFLNESASVHAFGSRVRGATIDIEPQYTFSLEAGYFLTPNIAVAVTAGAPPKAIIEGAGSIGQVGRLGSIITGPTTITVQYHFLEFGRLQPYVGIGPAVNFVFSEKDRAVRDLKVDTSVGVVGQIGANYMLDEHWGIFADVKAAWLGTRTHGFLGSAPIKADVRLDPVVVSTGIIYRF